MNLFKPRKMKECSLEECLNYLKNNLTRLASPYADQNAQIEDFARWNLPDDIASDWDNYEYFVKRLSDAEIFDEKIIAKFKEIMDAFSTVFINGERYEEIIWTHEGLKSHSFWKVQRDKASMLLNMLNQIKYS